MGVLEPCVFLALIKYILITFTVILRKKVVLKEGNTSRNTINKNSAEQSLSKSLSSFPLYINGNDTWNDAASDMW